MATGKISEQTIKKRYPHPVAAAWHRVALVSTEAEKNERLVACNEILLRTLAAFLLPDYLRGSEAPPVEAALRKLERPGDGVWLELVRELIRHVGRRKEPEPFLAEAYDWYFDAKGKPTDRARALDALISLRNTKAHGTAAVGPAQVRSLHRELHQTLRTALLDLGWLAGYRPFRVHSLEPQRRRRPQTGTTDVFFTGKLQFFVGTEAHPEPEVGEWDAFLDKEKVYLVNPGATGLLELDPFLALDHHAVTLQEHLHLIKALPGLKKVKRVHDESGSEILKGVEVDEGEISFERWLATRESLELQQSLRITGGSILLAQASGQDAAAIVSDRYEILEELGRGGMATVYRVRDRELGDEVALKVLNSDLAEDAQYRERFRREAASMRKVRHRFIVEVLDVGSLDGRPFLKMPVMTHGSLHDRIQAGGRAQGEVLGWAEDALEALEHIHAAGLIHRDVKPSNFLLDEEGHARLTDFGIALRAEDSRLTKTLEQMGTLAYMAPEQRTQKNVTDRADLYSLAVVLHELATGEIPRSPGKGVKGFLGELLRRLGADEADDRPSASEALKLLRARPGDASDSAPEASAGEPREPGVEPLGKESASEALAARAAEAPVALRPQPLVSTVERPRTGAAAALAVPEPAVARRLKLLAAGMLLAVFLINYLETGIEGWLRDDLGLGLTLERHLGEAALWLEGGLSFERHDVTNRLAVYGYSIVYFFVYPLFGLFAFALLARRRDPRPLLLLCAAAVVTYLLTLPFYLFFPVPERWTYPDSGAVLLSDLWTSKLIQAFRPFSGLNNCFPSFHVSTTVVVTAGLLTAGIRYRIATLSVAAMIVLSTFALGIHWLSDIVAGFALGVMSFLLTLRLLPRIESLLLRQAHAGARQPGLAIPVPVEERVLPLAARERVLQEVRWTDEP